MNGEQEYVHSILIKYNPQYALGYLVACKELEEHINNGIDYGYCIKYLKKIQGL